MSKRFANLMDDYAEYHHNPINKLTHYFGIPMIVFSLVVLLGRVEAMNIDGHSFSAAQLILTALALVYLSLHSALGIAMALIFFAMYAAAPAVGMITAWVLFVGGWVLQFIGHKYEGRNPAFFRNATHLLVGPLWILNDLMLKLRLPAYQPNRA
jgi:uncharacterized membrane protein YGL010W